MNKKIVGHALAILFFVGLVLVYFSPGIVDGKVLYQGDGLKFLGMSHELSEYYQKEDKGSAWTGAMFSGMPAYHIAMYGTPTNYLDYLERVVKRLDYTGGSMVLAGLICFYLLMCVMGVNRWLAIAGAMAFAFASYNIIIIAAGHVTKAYVIAYMPLTLAGMYLLFKQKWLWGLILFILGVTLSIFNNHLQITYYLALFCLFVYLGYAMQSIRDKKWADLGKVTGLLAAGVVLAVLPNLGNLYSNYEQAQESMRGPSELTAAVTGNEGKVSDGLEKDYAFEWSYGRSELLTLLIPNVYGGESGGTLDRSSELYKELRSRGQQTGNGVQTITYWGDQLFTSGPVYFGAVVCFLFVLGMVVIRNPMKWWIAGGSLFFILLSLGRNLDGFNDFMFHYLPMYSKFRVPSMALVIPGMTFPLVGIWGLSLILRQKTDSQLLKKGLLTALSVTGGLCLIVWLAPGLLLNFQSALDGRYQLPDWYYNALLMDRRSLAEADALRSLLFVLLGAGLVFWFYKAGDKKKTAPFVAGGIALLMLVDLWTVDKRYLNDKNYVDQQPAQFYQPTAANTAILKDQSPSYRVLNLNNPFSETNTSYFHKSIGGYHAAKLRRYQELIDHRLSGEIATLQQSKTVEEMMSALQHAHSLNMLNMRYIIYNPGQPPIVNPYAYGNAWFVDKVEVVQNADAEILALDRIDPRTTAVVDKRFDAEVKNLASQPDTAARIVLESYKPDELIYSSQSDSPQVAVFSEIYYPHGWEATIDGKPAPYFRADWTLRAMVVPAGQHQIVFRFVPKGYYTTAMISSVSSGIICLLLIGGIVFAVWRTSTKSKEEKKEETPC